MPTVKSALLLVAGIVVIRTIVTFATLAYSGASMSGRIITVTIGEALGFGASIGIYAMIALAAFKIVAYARG